MISRRWGIKDSHKIDVYLQHDGYHALEKALQRDDAGIDHRRSEEIEPARARRRGLPHRHEVVVCAEGFAEAEICDLQRRRIRAGHLQGPAADGDGSASDDRGHHHRRSRDRRAHGLHLYSRRISLRAGHRADRAGRSVRARLSRQEYSGLRIRFRSGGAHRRGRLRVRRRIRADGIARRQARLSAHQASLPCRRRTLRLPDDH